MVTVKLEQHAWEVGDELGAGGYGSVREARRDGVERAVAKFVPIEPGAQRELMIGSCPCWTVVCMTACTS